MKKLRAITERRNDNISDNETDLRGMGDDPTFQEAEPMPAIFMKSRESENQCSRLGQLIQKISGFAPTTIECHWGRAIFLGDKVSLSAKEKIVILFCGLLALLKETQSEELAATQLITIDRFKEHFIRQTSNIEPKPFDFDKIEIKSWINNGLKCCPFSSKALQQSGFALPFEKTDNSISYQEISNTITKSNSGSSKVRKVV